MRRTIIRQRRLTQTSGASRPGLSCGKAINLAGPLIRTEKKQFLFFYRAAEGESELVLLENGAGLVSLLQKKNRWR